MKKINDTLMMYVGGIKNNIYCMLLLKYPFNNFYISPIIWFLHSSLSFDFPPFSTWLRQAQHKGNVKSTKLSSSSSSSSSSLLLFNLQKINFLKKEIKLLSSNIHEMEHLKKKFI